MDRGMSDPRHAWVDRWHRRNYRFDGNDVLSVTTIIRNMYTYNLERWKVKRAVDVTLRMATRAMREVHKQSSPNDKGERHDSGAVYQILKELDKPTVAATQGIGVHEALESWFATGTVPEGEEREVPFIEQAIRWAEETNPKPLLLEPEVYAEVGYAGSVDALFEIDGEPVIVDYKTGGVFESAAMQLAAYQQADRIYPRVNDQPCAVLYGGECVCPWEAMPKVDKLAVLDLKPDSYELKWLLPSVVPLAWDAFQGALAMQKLKKERVLFAAETRQLVMALEKSLEEIA
jgi:hypothetical protein